MSCDHVMNNEMIVLIIKKNIDIYMYIHYHIVLHIYVNREIIIQKSIFNVLCQSTFRNVV